MLRVPIRTSALAPSDTLRHVLGENERPYWVRNRTMKSSSSCSRRLESLRPEDRSSAGEKL